MKSLVGQIQQNRGSGGPEIHETLVFFEHFRNAESEEVYIRNPAMPILVDSHTFLRGFLLYCESPPVSELDSTFTTFFFLFGASSAIAWIFLAAAHAPPKSRHW